MITRSEVERLAGLRSESGIVSTYINVDPRLGYERSQAAKKFKGAYRRALRSADASQRAILEREHDRIAAFLDGRRQTGRGLAIFSSTPDGIWQVHPLSVAVPSLVSAGHAPETRFLARALDEYPRLAVVMLDGGDARIYLAEQRQDTVESHVESELPNRHAQGGWAQARYQRHVDFHHSMHLREVAARLRDAFYKDGFTRLVVVGVDDATSVFAGLLTEAVRSRLTARLHADFKQENDVAILARAGEAAEADERIQEVALVEQVLGEAGNGGKGVLGTADTVRSLVEGRVDTLLLVEGLNVRGSACRDCDYFAAGEFEQCPVCAARAVDRVADVAELSVDRALETGAAVNFVYGEGADLLRANGGIGAILRYA